MTGHVCLFIFIFGYFAIIILCIAIWETKRNESFIKKIFIIINDFIKKWQTILIVLISFITCLTGIGMFGLAYLTFKILIGNLNKPRYVIVPLPTSPQVPPEPQDEDTCIIKIDYSKAKRELQIDFSNKTTSSIVIDNIQISYFRETDYTEILEVDQERPSTLDQPKEGFFTSKFSINYLNSSRVDTFEILNIWSGKILIKPDDPAILTVKYNYSSNAFLNREINIEVEFKDIEDKKYFREITI